jgi:hypothetical protein
VVPDVRKELSDLRQLEIRAAAGSNGRAAPRRASSARLSVVTATVLRRIASRLDGAPAEPAQVPVTCV